MNVRKINNISKILAAFTLSFFLFGCFDDPDVDNTSNNSQATSTIPNSNASSDNKSPDCNLSLKESNSWTDNNSNNYQLDINVKNNDERDITDWVLNTQLPKESKISQNWNCKVQIKDDNTLEITPEDYNNTIKSNETLNCGLIFSTKENYNPDDLKLVSSNLGSGEIKEKATTSNDADKIDNTNSSQETANVISSITKLQVKDTNIVDENENKIVLRGVSLHGINWFPQYVTSQTFASLKNQFNVNAVRLPLYTEEYNGYCNGGNQIDLLNLVENGIKYATENDMYIIVDWHILSDSNPNTNIAKAKEFFQTISSKYKNNQNILYEICNEPNGSTSWNDVANYANQIIPIIRSNTDDIIIVGTPTWCQDIDIASNSPLNNYKNIVYSLHFYAATHKDNIRQKANTAIQNKLPVIVSEFGICEASGNGTIDIDEANRWMNFIKENNLSYFIWNLSNKDEKSSLLNPSCTKVSDWQESDLSETGKWFLNQAK